MKPVAMTTPLDLAALIDAHQVGLWRYLRAIGCEATLAEDLIQETFLSVLEHPFENQGPGPTAAYLRKVARNLYLSSLRKSSRAISWEEIEEWDREWTRLAGHDAGDALLVALDSCLQGLEQRTREALEWQFRERRSREEIATRLGLTADGTKNLLQRAKKRLRACIEGKLNALRG